MDRIIDKISFVGQVSLLSFMNLNEDRSYDPSKKVSENFHVPARIPFFHVRTRLPRQPRLAIIKWPFNGLRANKIKEDCK